MAFADHPPRVRFALRSGLHGAGAITRAAALAVLILLLPACDEGARLSVVSHGVERWATVDRPVQPAGPPRPLLVVLHAALFSGSLARDELDLPALARRAGVALAFPEAEGMAWNDGSLSRALPGALAPTAVDLAFLDALIADLTADGTVDPAAIHVAG